jgi:hypothetical protein
MRVVPIQIVLTIQYLQTTYPRREFRLQERKITNIQQQARRDQASGGTDVGDLVDALQKLKRSKGWDFATKNINKTLTRLWWIDPDQMALLRDYGEVIVLDVCEGRNLYDYHLSTLIVVDGANATRSVGYCMHEQQDTDTFVWLFNCMAPYIPVGDPQNPRIAKFTAIFTDRDAAMAAAILAVWGGTVFHGICLWHLLQNMVKRLSGILRGEFQQFMHHF